MTCVSLLRLVVVRLAQNFFWWLAKSPNRQTSSNVLVCFGEKWPNHQKITKFLAKFWPNLIFWPNIFGQILVKYLAKNSPNCVIKNNFYVLCFFSVEFYFVFFYEYFLGDLFWKIRKKSEIFWEFIFFFPPEKTQQIFSSSNKKSIYRIIHRKKNCKKDLEYSGI